MNNISMKLNADNLIMLALQEDITSEDITRSEEHTSELQSPR